MNYDNKNTFPCEFDWVFVLKKMKQFDVDFASLYGVKIFETDFSGAIKRSLKHGIIHLNKEYINAILR